MGDQLKDGLGQAWALVATFVPKLIGFLLILFIGWLIAKGIAKGLTMVMHRFGFNRLIERTGLSSMTQRSGVDVGAILVKLVYYFVLLIALQLAFGVFGESNPVSALLNDVIAFLPRIVVSIVLVVVAAAIAKVVRDLIGSAMGDRPIAPLMGTIAYVFIVAIGAIAALNQVNVATTVTMPIMIAVLATVGGVIVVGFGGGLVRPMQARWDGWINRMQHQLTAGAPEPRKETAPGAAQMQRMDEQHAVRAGAQHGSAQHGSAQHGSAQHGVAQHGSAQHGVAQYGNGQPAAPTTPTGPTGPTASDAPTPPSGFEQQRPQH